MFIRGLFYKPRGRWKYLTYWPSESRLLRRSSRLSVLIEDEESRLSLSECSCSSSGNRQAKSALKWHMRVIFKHRGLFKVGFFWYHWFHFLMIASSVTNTSWGWVSINTQWTRSVVFAVFAVFACSAGMLSREMLTESDIFSSLTKGCFNPRPIMIDCHLTFPAWWIWFFLWESFPCHQCVFPLEQAALKVFQQPAHRSEAWFNKDSCKNQEFVFTYIFFPHRHMLIVCFNC